MGDRIMVVLKFIAAALLLPLVIATVLALEVGVGELHPGIAQAVITGTIAYVLMKFFVYDFDAVYKFGQSVVGSCFQFLKPVMNFAPYVIPIYTLIVIIVYVIMNALNKLGTFEPLFAGVIAFTFAMHIILTAQDLYKKDNVLGKPNYFFSMGLIFIVDVFLMVMLFSLAGKGLSFIQFFNNLSATSCEIYIAVFKQLFLR
ncbi:MAG: hypothetical protein V2A70_05060 [Candidatus Omnitrophota bacterium]